MLVLAEARAADGVDMASKGAEWLERFQIPQADALIPTGGGEGTAIGAEGDAADSASMASRAPEAKAKIAN
jgi:hypothetical protein